MGHRHPGATNSYTSALYQTMKPQGNPDLKIGSTSLKKWDQLASNTDRKTDVDLRIVLSDSLILNPVIARNTPTNAGLTSDFHILFVWYWNTGILE